jgi:hypothetical protein
MFLVQKKFTNIYLMESKTFLLTKLEKKSFIFFSTTWHDKNAINESMIRKRKSIIFNDDVVHSLQQNHVFYAIFYD